MKNDNQPAYATVSVSFAEEEFKNLNRAAKDTGLPVAYLLRKCFNEWLEGDK